MLERSALVLAVLAAACTSAVAPDTTSVGDTLGRLAVLDEDGDVVVVDPDGENRVEVTTDGGEGVLYTQPVWSADGRSLAWGQFDSTGFAVGIADVDVGEPTLVPMSNHPFYTYWSPADDRIGVLHNSAGEGLDFEIIDVAGGTSTVLDQGAPYYFSWSPSGDGLVTHVGPDRFDRLDLDGSRVSLGSTAPGYLAPHWTDAGIFHIAGGALAIERDDGRQPLVGVAGVTTFVANPQGTHVALQWVGGEGGLTAAYPAVARIPSNVLAVVDVSTAGVEIVTQEPSVGFFWSPDGQALLILALNEAGDALEASVWAVDGILRSFGAFIPHLSLIRDVLPFFPQYAQSLSFWAPDSSAFAYAGEVDGARGVWVQHLEAGEPELVSPGTWVAWSSG